jgi:polyhydroxybutyrate depolymerase
MLGLRALAWGVRVLARDWEPFDPVGTLGCGVAMRRRLHALRAPAIAVVAAAATILVFGTLGHSPAIVAAAPCPGATAVAGDRVLTVPTADGPRTARLHVPRGALGHPAGLLLAFHGVGGDGRFMESYSRLGGAEASAGIVGLFPDALHGRWNLEDEGGPDDVGFVRALLDVVDRYACVEPARVWAAGVSNGGGFAARLACVLADRLSGVAVVAGGFGALPECRPARPVPVLEIHGTADPVVPYEGRDADDHRGAVLPWVRSWVRMNGCMGTARGHRLSPRAVRLQWSACRNGTRVSHIVVDGGRHQWPQASPPDAGPDAGVSAAAQVVAFLQGG